MAAWSAARKFRGKRRVRCLLFASRRHFAEALHQPTCVASFSTGSEDCFDPLGGLPSRPSSMGSRGRDDRRGGGGGGGGVGYADIGGPPIKFGKGRLINSDDDGKKALSEATRSLAPSRPQQPHFCPPPPPPPPPPQTASTTPKGRPRASSPPMGRRGKAQVGWRGVYGVAQLCVFNR